MAHSFDAQHAAKLSAEELQQLTKELFNWSKDAKQKAARKGPAAEAAPAAAAASQSSGGPPQPEHEQHEQAGAGATRHPTAHTYEHYRDKWDKFDVDAALAAEEEADKVSAAVNGGNAAGTAPPCHNSTRRRTSHSTSKPMDIPQARVTVLVGPSPLPAAASGTGSTCPDPAPAPTTASDWKDVGNEHFKQGRYHQAVECYTVSLELHPSCLAAANRAMARLKLGQHEAAEEDCSLALHLDAAYVKAYQRRATARRQLDNLLGTVEDCEAVLCLEPNNKQAAVDRAECVQQLLHQYGLQPPSRIEQLAVRVTEAAAAGGAAAPAAPAVPAAGSGGDELIKVSSVQRSKPAKGPATPEAAAAAAQGSTSHLPAQQLLVQEQHVGDAKQMAPGTTPVASVQVLEADDGDESMPDLVKPHPVVQPQQQERQQEQEQEQQGKAGCVQRQQVNRLECQLTAEQAQQLEGVAAAVAKLEPMEQERDHQSAAPPAPAAPAAGGRGGAAGTAGLPAARPVSASSAAAPAPGPLRIARTGLGFEKAWKGFKGDPQQQASYLLALPPAQLPVLLKQALSPALLAAAASALLRPALQQQPETAVALLEELAGVARFDINLMSVPPRQKAQLREAWDAAKGELAAADGQLAGRLAEVRRKYKL